MNFEIPLKNKISEALQSLYSFSVSPSEIILQETKNEFEGDVTLVVFPFTKASKRNPEETAKEIGAFLQSNLDVVHGFNVVKGFLNVSIDDSFWRNFFAESSGRLQKDEDVFFLHDILQEHKGKKWMVEYSSPNTNKPLHLGHIRNNLLGYSVAEILKATGYDVVKTNIVNDRGIHICKSMLAWKKLGNGETPQSSGMKSDHLVGKYYVLFDQKMKEETSSLMDSGMKEDEAKKKSSLMIEVQEMLRKWEDGDKETIDLWKMMNGWVYDGFAVSYRKLGVDFDKIYYESQTYLHGKEIVKEGLSKNVFQKFEDGSVRIDLTDVGLDQKVLLRSDGTSVYITQDLGTAQLRFDDYPGLEKLIYVVGNEQEYHFKVLSEIFKKLQRPWAGGLHHLSYGMVDLPSGKMKSREGTVVDADDLIDEMVKEAERLTKELGKIENFSDEEADQLYFTIGMGALKYFILKVDPKKRMLFNPADSIDFNGNTGPFIQYTYARIKSVLKKGESNFEFRPEYSGSNFEFRISSDEKELVKLIYQYPKILSIASSEFSPAQIANYVYELAKSFNHFYHGNTIVDAEDKETSIMRLKLAELTAAVIKHAMRLLGIDVPERM